jgi:hypothetical protein
MRVLVLAALLTSTSARANQPLEITAPFLNYNDGVVINVQVGGHALPMLVDTGATISSIPPAFANKLIAEGHAVVISGSNVALADGSLHYQNRVAVDGVTIGKRKLGQIFMTVSDGQPLLGLPELTAMGKFTIDAQQRVVTFSAPIPLPEAATRDERERMATDDFARCRGRLKGDPDVMLLCATQTLDAWGAPRK